MRFGQQRQLTQCKARFPGAATEYFMHGRHYRGLTRQTRHRPPHQATNSQLQGRCNSIPAGRHLRAPDQATGPHHVGVHCTSSNEFLGRSAPRSGGVPYLLCRQPRQVGRRSAPSETAASACGPRVRHNPSLKPSPNGGPPGPGHRYGVHFLWPGPGVPPSVPA